MAERGMTRTDDSPWVAEPILRTIESDRDEAYLGRPEKPFARRNGA